MRHFIAYLFFRVFVAIFSILPFRILYILSDGLAFILHRIVGYRYKVVYDNLTKSFPNKSEQEIQQIIKASYRNLSDITIEGIKGMSKTPQQLAKRYKYVDYEFMNDFHTQNQSFIIAGGHYCNWEWSITVADTYLDYEYAIGIYKPLSNPYINNFIKKVRGVGKMKLVPLKQTTKGFDSSVGKQTIACMLCDQSPSNVKDAHWIQFLGRETACLHGVEKHAKRLNYQVVFYYAKRVKRGYYEAYFKVLHDNPQATADGELTELFMQRLEEVLLEAPENWLWTHRRWKRKRPVVL